MVSHDRLRTNVAVIGAAGYVGQKLCSVLRSRDYNVTGVCRPYATFLVERLGVDALTTVAIDGSQRFDLVVNLAYPTRGLEHSRRAHNDDILTLISRLLASGGRVVHTSTLAVFGFDLEVPPSVGPVVMRADYEYCVSKIQMEHALTRAFVEGDLHIVRLGNVWGPGSPNWTAGLLSRLWAGLPIGVRGRSGWSNVTDVANVCDYIDFLLRQPSSPGVHYHHLAELGAARWSEFVTCLASALGIEPVHVDAVPPRPQTWPDEFRVALSHLSLNGAINSVMRSQRLGAKARAVVSRLPAGLLATMKRTRGEPPAFPLGPNLNLGDAQLCSIMSCPTQFLSSTDPQWMPPVSLEASFAAVQTWMAEVGYA
jgi:nucleoside-diphosphate-sugar epimerase